MRVWWPVGLCTLFSVAMGSLACSDPAQTSSSEQPDQTPKTPTERAVPDPEPLPAPLDDETAGGDANVETSAFGSLELESGFMPDPRKLQGETTGADDASVVFHPECSGWVTATRPDHTLTAVKRFENLRILIHSEDAALSLILKKPDGTFVCSRGAEGEGPILEGALEAGSYAIWIGNPNPNTQVHYTIGFSELNSTTADSLAE